MIQYKSMKLFLFIIITSLLLAFHLEGQSEGNAVYVNSGNPGSVFIVALIDKNANHENRVRATLYEVGDGQERLVHSELFKIKNANLGLEGNARGETNYVDVYLTFGMENRPEPEELKDFGTPSLSRFHVESAGNYDLRFQLINVFNEDEDVMLPTVKMRIFEKGVFSNGLFILPRTDSKEGAPEDSDN